MPTKWVVTTPGDHIELDGENQAETTFTVTNPGSRVDRVVFDIAVGDGADPSWFTVENPQRRVPPSGSVSYLMKTSIPADAKAGSYSVQGRAYSADSAPEEDSVLSSRLAFAIAAKEGPAPKKKLPSWWIYVVAGLAAVVVLVVAGVLIFGGAKKVTAPDVTHEPLGQAKTNLAVFGLSVGVIRYKQDTANPNVVISQSVVGGTKVPQDKPVDLVVTTSLSAPTPAAPVPNATVPATAVAPGPTHPVPTEPGQFEVLDSPSPTPSPGTVTSGLLRWTDTDRFVTHWQVSFSEAVCLTPNLSTCVFVSSAVVRVDQPSYTPIAPITPSTSPNAFPVPKTGLTMFPMAVYQWSVAAVDDFGNAGPSSPVTTYVVG